MASSFSIFASFTDPIMEAIKSRKDDYMTVLLGLVMIVAGVYLVCNGGNK